MNNWKRYMLYATNMDPQILVMWTRSSSNVAKYLSDTITDQIKILYLMIQLKNAPIIVYENETCLKHEKWLVPKENENGANNYDDHFEEALLETTICKTPEVAQIHEKIKRELNMLYHKEKNRERIYLSTIILMPISHDKWGFGI